MNRRLLWLAITCIALLVGALYLVGSNPSDAVTTLFRGTLGSPQAIAGTLRETTPLLIMGIAVFLALQAGLFNIGVEGQFLVGALATAGVALRFPGPAGLVLGCCLGTLVGACWAFFPAWIKAYRGGHEVITTIMLNSVAGFLTTALVAGPLKDPKQQSPTTAIISSRLPWLVDTETMQVSSGIIFGIALVAGFAYWMKRYVAGYELRAVGLNAEASQRAGIDPKRVILRTMVISGAIAGFAGAIQVLGYEGRFYADFSPGYGFTSLGVGLLAGTNPVGLLWSALLFGVLGHGSSSLQVLGVPKGIGSLALGITIAIAAAIRYRKASLEGEEA